MTSIHLASFPLYLSALAFAFCVSWIATPLVRRLALFYGWLDQPSSSIKTHKIPTPSLGGIAIYIAYVSTLIFLRFWTQFPTGTLRSLRGLLVGGTLVFALGVVDDLRKPKGLGFKTKFAVQAVAASMLLLFDMRIHFINPYPIAVAVTVLWVVGITNSLNLIDVLDGLCGSQAALCALGFFLISFKAVDLYVNFAAVALAGAALGFLPWNFSSKSKIFMGDSGSLLLGFLLAGLSLSARYSRIESLGVYAPLLILIIPIYDTFFIMFLRLRRGQSPFLGSKDHFALRLQKMGYTKAQIVLIAATASVVMSFWAYLVTRSSVLWAVCLYAVAAAEILLASRFLMRVNMND